MMLTLFFLFSVAAAPISEALSFNYTVFNSADPNITYERAYVNGEGAIQLTANNRANIGRATSSKPMQLWDKSTGNLTDFETYFSFIIDSNNRTAFGDGLAFFLAPVGSRIPDNLTKGGTLGLTSRELFQNSSSNPFVAVEFDVYKNHWDPPGTHAGIDIDSVVSVTNISWLSNVTGGKTNEAWINYDSVSKNLSVVFTGYRNATRVLQYLSHVFDLRLWLPEQVIFGFSGSTGNASAAHIVTAWNFSSNLEINRTVTPPSSQRGSKVGLAVGLSIGGLILVTALMGLVWFCWCRKRNGDEAEEDEILQYMSGELQMESSGPKKFLYSELANATSNFKAEEKLGEGGFGGVYKGFLQSTSLYVAVKRISSKSKQGLIGWCHERKELLLVYEFMPNGSLDFHLFKGRSFLPGNIRYKIAQGLASALLYLHEEWEQCVVHRDIKSSNIMLDSDYNTKLGDFGLARLTFRATKESDIYSFGVVCLEIACGRRPVDSSLPEDQVVLVGWVWKLQEKGEILKAADPRLGSDFNEPEIERLLIIGLSCTLTDARRRPSAKQALHVLEFNSPLPVLPAEGPAGLATYFPALENPEGDQHRRSSTTSISNQTFSSSQFSSQSGATASSSSLDFYGGRDELAVSSREGGGGDVTTSQRAEQRRGGHDREETGTEDGSAPSAEGVSGSVGEGYVRVYDGTVKLGSSERNRRGGGELRLGCCQRFPERMAVEGSSFLLPTYTYKTHTLYVYAPYNCSALPVRRRTAKLLRRCRWDLVGLDRRHIGWVCWAGPKQTENQPLAQPNRVCSVTFCIHIIQRTFG
ncbi:hypothetical protein CRG98_046392 [Punica granatum]|uniref:Protein kinase domain-containing protein n=1 Tax=Punica granatum TaxID=22663 RepID=A0A2I0HNT0_PUNGR|nr:hypothetical protein CRG98_046392 [Punica granatum]